MGYIIERKSGICAIRKRTRDSVTQEHIRYYVELIYRIGRLMNAQYRRTVNQKKWNRIKQYLDLGIKDWGEVLGGRVEVSVDQERLTVEVLYRGKSLELGNEDIQELILPAESLSVTQKDGDFCFALLYGFYDIEQVADYSERIQALRFCLHVCGDPKRNVSENETTPRIDAEPEMM